MQAEGLLGPDADGTVAFHQEVEHTSQASTAVGLSKRRTEWCSQMCRSRIIPNRLAAMLLMQHMSMQILSVTVAVAAAVATAVFVDGSDTRLSYSPHHASHTSSLLSFGIAEHKSWLNPSATCFTYPGT